MGKIGGTQWHSVSLTISHCVSRSVSHSVTHSGSHSISHSVSRVISPGIRIYAGFSLICCVVLLVIYSLAYIAMKARTQQPTFSISCHCQSCGCCHCCNCTSALGTAAIELFTQTERLHELRGCEFELRSLKTPMCNSLNPQILQVMFLVVCRRVLSAFDASTTLPNVNHTQRYQ